MSCLFQCGLEPFVPEATDGCRGNAGDHRRLLGDRSGFECLGASPTALDGSAGLTSECPPARRAPRV